MVLLFALAYLAFSALPGMCVSPRVIDVSNKLPKLSLARYCAKLDVDRDIERIHENALYRHVNDTYDPLGGLVDTAVDLRLCYHIHPRLSSAVNINKAAGSSFKSPRTLLYHAAPTPTNSVV